MSIAAISPTVSSPVLRTPEALEGPGRDHDGDADDKGAGAIAAASVKPPGMGNAVDTKA